MLAPTEPVATGVVRNGEDPRREFGAGLERPQAAEGFEKGLLRCVAGFLDVAKSSVGEMLDGSVVPLDERSEGVGVPPERHRHQIAVVGLRSHSVRRSLCQECRHASRTRRRDDLFRTGAEAPRLRAGSSHRNNGPPGPYLGQELSRRLNPQMTTILNKTLPTGARPDQALPTLPSDDRNSAQSLRPTFDGWGPRLYMSRAYVI